jgi:hypothetical protein
LLKRTRGKLAACHHDPDDSTNPVEQASLTLPEVPDGTDMIRIEGLLIMQPTVPELNHQICAPANTRLVLAATGLKGGALACHPDRLARHGRWPRPRNPRMPGLKPDNPGAPCNAAPGYRVSNRFLTASAFSC